MKDRCSAQVYFGQRIVGAFKQGNVGKILDSFERMNVATNKVKGACCRGFALLDFAVLVGINAVGNNLRLKVGVWDIYYLCLSD